jgi:hypothetical protein
LSAKPFFVHVHLGEGAIAAVNLGRLCPYEGAPLGGNCCVFQDLALAIAGNLYILHFTGFVPIAVPRIIFDMFFLGTGRVEERKPCDWLSLFLRIFIQI